jgi:hypothetical protein
MTSPGTLCIYDLPPMTVHRTLIQLTENPSACQGAGVSECPAFAGICGKLEVVDQF